MVGVGGPWPGRGGGRGEIPIPAPFGAGFFCLSSHFLKIRRPFVKSNYFPAHLFTRKVPYVFRPEHALKPVSGTDNFIRLFLVM